MNKDLFYDLETFKLIQRHPEEFKEFIEKLNKAEAEKPKVKQVLKVCPIK